MRREEKRRGRDEDKIRRGRGEICLLHKLGRDPERAAGGHPTVTLHYLFNLSSSTTTNTTHAHHHKPSKTHTHTPTHTHTRMSEAKHSQLANVLIAHSEAFDLTQTYAAT